MSTVAVRLTGTRRRILVALNDQPVEDPAGLAVHRLAERVGGWSLEALSALLARMERHGLVERTVRGRRTYRLGITDLGRSIARLPAPPPQRHTVSVEEMPDGPASTWGTTILSPVPASADPNPKASGAPAGPVAESDGPGSRPVAASTGREVRKAANRLTKARVEVLRVLLAGGPIDDPSGHATRILMGRLGRTDLPGTHMVVTGMVRAGLVRRTLNGRRVVRLEAIPDALSPRDLRLVWSTTAFPVATNPAAPAPSSAASISEVEELRTELAATRGELARVRLQLEMFRAWAKRMPDLDPSDDDRPLPPRAGSGQPAAERISPDTAAASGAGSPSRPLCQYVHPDSHPDAGRRGRPCELQVWDGSDQWCWHHDPRPIGRRRAPVRRVRAA